MLSVTSQCIEYRLIPSAAFMRNFVISDPPASFSLFLAKPLSRVHQAVAFNNALPPTGGNRFFGQALRFVLDHPEQQKVAISMINGLYALVLIHGPPGTGKTFVIAQAMLLRNALGCTEKLARDRTIHYYTVITAMTNHDVINAASALYAAGVKGFKLVMAEDTYELAKEEGSPILEEMDAKKIILRPRNIFKEHGNDKEGASKKIRDLIRGSKFLIMTVHSPYGYS